MVGFLKNLLCLKYGVGESNVAKARQIAIMATYRTMILKLFWVFDRNVESSKVN